MACIDSTLVYPQSTVIELPLLPNNHNQRQRPPLCRQKAFRIAKENHTTTANNARLPNVLANLLSSRNNTTMVTRDESDTASSSNLDDISSFEITFLDDDSLGSTKIHNTQATTSSSSSSSSTTTARRSVSFATATFHYHNTVLGDGTPAISSGAPIALGWKCLDRDIVRVDDNDDNALLLEARRRCRCEHSSSSRLSLLKLSAAQRQGMLMAAGVSLMDIQRQAKLCDALRLSWQQSVLEARANRFPIVAPPNSNKKKHKIINFPKRIFRRLFHRRSF